MCLEMIERVHVVWCCVFWCSQLSSWCSACRDVAIVHCVCMYWMYVCVSDSCPPSKMHVRVHVCVCVCACGPVLSVPALCVLSGLCGRGTVEEFSAAVCVGGGDVRREGFLH